MTCASLSVVLVFEPEQSYSRIISWGCGRTMRSYSNAKSTLKVPLTFNKVVKIKRKNFDFVHLSFFLSFFLFIKRNWKIILCMRTSNILNGCSADQDHSCLFSALCELLLASYGLKTASKMLRVLGCRLLGLLFTYSWCGHTQTTERV